MSRALRQQLRDLIGQASHADGLLAEGAELPEGEAAATLAELAALNERLAAVSDRLERALPGPVIRGGRVG